MLSKTLAFAASAGLLFVLAGTAAQAQANWTKGIAYSTTSYKLNPGAKGTATGNPATDLKVSVAPNPSLYMGADDANGGTTNGVDTVYQPYYWNGGSTRTPLNIQINIGASGSGTGSYSVTCDAHATLPNGYVSGAHGSAPSAFNFPPNNNPPSNLQAWYDVANPNSTYGQSTNAGWVVTAHVSADARMQGGTAQAEALVIFGQPF